MSGLTLADMFRMRAFPTCMHTETPSHCPSCRPQIRRCANPSYMCRVDPNMKFFVYCKGCFIHEVNREDDYFALRELAAKLSEYRRLHVKLCGEDAGEARKFIGGVPDEVTLICECGKDATRISVGYHEQDECAHFITWCSTCMVPMFDDVTVYSLDDFCE